MANIKEIGKINTVSVPKDETPIKYVARSILPPGTDIEEFKKQTEDYTKRHPELVTHY